MTNLFIFFSEKKILRFLTFLQKKVFEVKLFGMEVVDRLEVLDIVFDPNLSKMGMSIWNL